MELFYNLSLIRTNTGALLQGIPGPTFYLLAPCKALQTAKMVGLFNLSYGVVTILLNVAHISSVDLCFPFRNIGGGR